MGKTLNKLLVPNPIYDSVPKDIHYFCIRYTGYASFKLRSEISKICSKFYPQMQVRVVFKPMKTLKNFFKLKDVIPDKLKSCLVYKYTCNICSEFYIGKTTKTYFFRKCQHMGISDRTGKKLTTLAFSNIRNHCIAKCHPILDSNFEILGTYSENNLKLAESLWTHKEKPTIGSNETSVPLNCFK